MIFTRTSENDYQILIDGKTLLISNLGQPDMSIENIKVIDLESIKQFLIEHSKELRTLTVGQSYPLKAFNPYQMTTEEANQIVDSVN